MKRKSLAKLVIYILGLTLMVISWFEEGITMLLLLISGAILSMGPSAVQMVIKAWRRLHGNQTNS